MQIMILHASCSCLISIILLKFLIFGKIIVPRHHIYFDVLFSTVFMNFFFIRFLNVFTGLSNKMITIFFSFNDITIVFKIFQIVTRQIVIKILKW